MARPPQPVDGLGDLLRRIERVEANQNREASRYRPPIAPIVSGAGKVTVADTDFGDIPPPDGAMAGVLNTTDNTLRLAMRRGGAWVVSAALS